jgi:hypothetical protein
MYNPTAAEVAFMFNEWYRPDCKLEFPRGGSMAMIEALVRGVEKRGNGKVRDVRRRYKKKKGKRQGLSSKNYTLHTAIV